MCATGYIGEFELVDDHRAGKIVVELNGRLNKCGVISPRYNIGVSELEAWTARLLPSRQVCDTCHDSHVYGLYHVCKISQSQELRFRVLVCRLHENGVSRRSGEDMSMWRACVLRHSRRCVC